MSLFFCPSQPLLFRRFSNFSSSCTPFNTASRTSAAKSNRCRGSPGELLGASVRQTQSESSVCLPFSTRMGIKLPDGKDLRAFKILAGAAIAALFVSANLDVRSALGYEHNHAVEESLKPKLALVPVPQRLSQDQEFASSEFTSPLRARWEVHSVDSRTETLFVVSNQTPSTVDLWWIDYCGREVFYASINPGGTHMQPSYATHPWVVRDHLSQNPVLMLVATANPFLAIVNSV